MVRVRADFCHDLNGLRLLNAAGFQETDQFRDNHGRMGIIDLYCSILIQVMQVTAPCNALFQNQLSRVAYHEILLVYAKQSARLVRVIRIQEQGHVLCNLALIKMDTTLDQALINTVHIEQTQKAALSFVTGNGNLIHGGIQREITELHLIALVCTAKPALLPPAKPLIRRLVLFLIFKYLFEQAAVISQPYAVRGKSQGGAAVQKTCCQSAQTAISQRRFQFELFQLGQIFSCFCQFFFDVVIQTQIDQVVAQQFSDQEFCGNIV